MKVWPAVDTPAWVGRDLNIFPDVLSVLRPPEREARSLKNNTVEILYPIDFMPEHCPEQVKAMKGFIEDLEKSPGCTYRQISIKEDWQRTAPVEEKNLHEYLYSVGFI